MRLKSALLLAAAMFLLTVLVRLPAAALSWLLPANVQCLSPSGTLWQGECTELRMPNLELAGVRWSLHAWSLLRARASFDLQSDDPRATGSTHLTLHPDGDMDLDALQATVPMPGPFSPLPPGWSGQLALDVAQASLRNSHIASLEGVITARQLHSEQPTADLGSFELRFPGNGTAAESRSSPMIGALRDLEGPLSVQATVTLTPNGAYELEGSLAARPDAAAELQQLLQMLGPADAQGRRPFSLAGTL